MNTFRFGFLGILLPVFIVSSVFLWQELKFRDSSLVYDQYEIPEKGEGRPKEEISKEEKAVNERKRQRYLDSQLNSRARRTLSSGESSYANGQVAGTWRNVGFYVGSQVGKGYRCLGSAYDQQNDIIYIISYSGHLWRVDRDEQSPGNSIWTPLNIKENFNGFLRGINMANGAFVLVWSKGSRMKYSDDEGRTWHNATGVSFNGTTWNGATVKRETGNRIIVVGNNGSGSFEAFYSDDDGMSYKSSGFSLPTNTYSLRVVSPTFSQDAYIVARNKTTQKIEVYKWGVNDNTFALLHDTDQVVSGISRLLATKVDGKVHFYVSQGKNIYYSSDEGATWRTTNTDNTGIRDVLPRAVHPTKPQYVYRGYLDFSVSSNNGTSFGGTRHKLGWDIQHMSTYETKEGRSFLLVGNDFGSFISYTPDDMDTYIQLNGSSPIQMAYDAAESQDFRTYYTALQDRGTRVMIDKEGQTGTWEIRSTDGLRVETNANGSGVWTWMYFGAMYHKTMFRNDNPRQERYFTGDWWAAPLVSSPNFKEDAVYAAFGNSLTKFTYDKFNKKIIETNHYYDFSQHTGAKIAGFGYSPVNRKRWYVSTSDGKFFFSSDGGHTFQESSKVPNAPKSSGSFRKNQQVIVGDPVDPMKVYFAGQANSFLISTDGGVTFTNHNSGLDVFRFRGLAVSPNGKYVFGACATAGAWVYSTQDDKWHEMNDEFVPDVAFVNVEYIYRDDVVRFATHGNGILNFELNINQEIAYPDSLTIQELDGGVQLTWKDNSTNENGFIVQKSPYGQFFKTIDTVKANTMTFVDSTSFEATEAFYRVVAFNDSKESHPSPYKIYEVPQEEFPDKSGWKLVSVSNEDDGAGKQAENAFDGNVNTAWVTEWFGNPVPTHSHEMVIDMNDTIRSRAFGYYPRQDHENGRLREYELYLSMNLDNWGDPISKGAFEDVASESIVPIPVTTARYIKLVSMSSWRGNSDNSLNMGSCGEITLYKKVPSTTPKPPIGPQWVQAGMKDANHFEFRWIDASKDETGFVFEKWIDGQFVEVGTVDEGTTTWELPVSYGDSNRFRLAAFNQNGKSKYTDEVSFVVPINHFPVILSPKTVETKEDSIFRYTISAKDEDGDNLEILIENVSPWLRIGISNNVFGIPKSDQEAGSFDVIVKDGKNGITSQTVTVNIIPVNDAPSLLSPVKFSGQEDVPLEYNIELSDEEGDSVTIQISDLPDWLTLKGNVISGTPIDGILDWEGSFEVVLKDERGAESSQIVDYNIKPVNDAPVIGLVDQVKLVDGDTIILEVRLSDVDSEIDSLELSLEILDGTIGADNFKLSGIGAERTLQIEGGGFLGSHQVKLLASDGEDTSSVSFLLIVERSETNSVTGITIPDLNKISVYPNPVITQLKIDMDDELLWDYRLVGVAGNLMAQGDFVGSKMINFGNAKSGVYLLILESGNKKFTMPILKK